jgi:hypothetical protein
VKIVRISANTGVVEISVISDNQPIFPEDFACPQKSPFDIVVNIYAGYFVYIIGKTGTYIDYAEVNIGGLNRYLSIPEHLLSQQYIP